MVRKENQTKFSLCASVSNSYNSTFFSLILIVIFGKMQMQGKININDQIHHSRHINLFFWRRWWWWLWGTKKSWVIYNKVLVILCERQIFRFVIFKIKTWKRGVKITKQKSWHVSFLKYFFVFCVYFIGSYHWG